MKSNPQVRAWKMIHLNKKLGLKGKNTLTMQKINWFIENCNPTPFVCKLLANITDEPEVIAQKINEPLSKVNRFYLHAIESAVLGIPKIGFALELKALIKAKNKKFEKRILRAKKRAKAKEKPYNSEGKKIIRKEVIRLVKEESSPKTGIVLTLPCKFDVEKKMVANPKLANLSYHGCEFPYSATKTKQSNKVLAEQQEILSKNQLLRERMLIRKEDINNVISIGRSDQYAHMFLDYCSTLSTNRKPVMKALKHRIVQKGGLVWLTFSSRTSHKGGEHTPEHFSKILKKYGKHYEACELQNLKPAYRKHYGSQVPVKGLYCYGTGKNGSGCPMYVAVLRRVA